MTIEVELKGMLDEIKVIENVWGITRDEQFIIFHYVNSGYNARETFEIKDLENIKILEI